MTEGMTLLLLSSCIQGETGRGRRVGGLDSKCGYAMHGDSMNSMYIL